MTINLNEFDKVDEKVDKSKTWLYVAGKCLISKELPKYDYYNLYKKYDPELNTVNYYIVFCKENINNELKITHIDDYGRIKIPISSIYKESGLYKEKKDCNISLKEINKDEDSVVYLIDY